MHNSTARRIAGAVTAAAFLIPTGMVATAPAANAAPAAVTTMAISTTSSWCGWKRIPIGRHVTSDGYLHYRWC